MTVSALTFGSMRMLERELPEPHWEDLLAASIERGVTTCHSSEEYASFPLFRAVLDRLRARGLAARLQHIVKLADPHFGETRFEPARLGERVDRYLAALKVDRLEIVQWMWRGDLKDEAARLAGVAAQDDEIGAAFDALRAAGKVGACVPFPYTTGFADCVLPARWCGGLAVYLNPVEPESIPLAREAAATRRVIVALRPLAAGRALESGASARAALDWTLAQPAVVTGVISYSSRDHLEELVRRAS